MENIVIKNVQKVYMEKIAIMCVIVQEDIVILQLENVLVHQGIQVLSVMKNVLQVHMVQIVNLNVIVMVSITVIK